MPTTRQDALVEALVEDPDRADLPDADRAMLAYAAELTLRPQSIGPDAIDRLRRSGLDDRTIHDVNAITAYFAFVNRVADGLGVELEDR